MREASLTQLDSVGVAQLNVEWTMCTTFLLLVIYYKNVFVPHALGYANTRDNTKTFTLTRFKVLSGDWFKECLNMFRSVIEVCYMEHTSEL